MRTMFGALLVFIGVNTAVCAWPLLPDAVPGLIRWAVVDLGLLCVALGMTLIARIRLVPRLR